MRRTLLAATVLAASGLSLSTAPAKASPPLCDGRPATVVGNGYQYRLDGTAGDDVIVTEDASEVYAGDGDDLICVTGDDPASVSGGTGDDTIDATGASASVLAYPGAGDDTFTGGGEGDTVDDSGGGSDQIGTGGGSDVVSWNLDGNALPDTGADHVDLGSGNDRMDAAYSSLGTTLLGGDGDDLLIGLNTAALPAADYTYDAGRGELQVDGADTEPFSGFEQYSFAFSGRSDTFLGTDAPEHVFATGAAPTTIDLGGGNDILGGFLSDFTADGGSGHDLLQDAYGARSASTVLDLARGTLAHTGPGLSVTGRLTGFEDATVAGPGSVKVVGDTDANRLTVTDSCATSIAGGGAADVLRVVAAGTTSGLDCTGARISGGAGDDVMTGSAQDDTLLGGAGHDTARGGGGRDTCRAEVRINCEAM